MADMTVGSAIRPLARTYVIERRAQPVHIKGVKQEGAVVKLSVAGLAQQAKPGELMFLPEGARSSDYYWFTSKTPLRVSDVALQQLSDRVVIGGRKYEIVKLMDRTLSGGGHYKALCARLGQ